MVQVAAHIYSRNYGHHRAYVKLKRTHLQIISSDFESVIRLAISIGGDSDTIVCITGGIAATFYKEIPQELVDFVIERLPNELLR